MKKIIAKTTALLLLGKGDFLKVLTLVFTMMFSFGLNAQTVDPLRTLNNNLRVKFGGLLRPMPTKEYNYDMAGHQTEKTQWTNLNPKTFINTDIWYKMYLETYFMAFDTLPLLTDEAIFNNVANLNANEVPIGIRDIDYYYFKSDALNTNKYFDFDIINNIITDKPGRVVSPFLTKNLFIAAPLYSSTNDASNTKFIIDPSWIFKDLANANYYTLPYQLKINFGDGTGFHFFNPSLSNSYIANYTTLGEKEIDVQLIQDGQLIKQSKNLSSV